MANIGTTFTKSGKKAVLCGSGELGKEVALELQRYGVEVVALDKYANAPAMHVAHGSHVLSMLDGDALEAVILFIRQIHAEERDPAYYDQQRYQSDDHECVVCHCCFLLIRTDKNTRETRALCSCHY